MLNCSQRFLFFDESTLQIPSEESSEREGARERVLGERKNILWFFLRIQRSKEIIAIEKERFECSSEIQMITGNAVQKYKQGGILNSASVTELYGRLDIGTNALLVNRTPHYIIKGTSSHYFR